MTGRAFDQKRPESGGDRFGSDVESLKLPLDCD